MKVRIRFFAILLTVVLSSLLFTSTIAISVFSTDITNEIIHHNEETISLFKDIVYYAISQRFANFQGNINYTYLGNNIDFNNNSISLNDVKDVNFLLNKVNNKMQKSFSSLSVYTAKGIKLTSLNNSNNWYDLGYNISNENLLKNSIQGKVFQDEHLWYSPVSKNFFVLLSAPLYSSLRTDNVSNIISNKLVGVIVASYPVSELFEGMLNNQINKDSILYLVSYNGTIIYSTNDHLSQLHPLLSTLSNSIIGSKFNDQPIYNQIVGSSNVVESGIYPHNGNDSRSSLFVAAKESINNSSINYNHNDFYNDNLLNNLILVSEWDAGIAFKDMFNLRNAFVISTFVILVGISIVAVYASRNISRPLIKLKDSAISITNGNLDNIIKPVSDDEIGELATQFEKVRVNIKQYIDYILKKDKELEKANRELIENENKKDEFISMISHELRTPLVPIKGYTEMLLKHKLIGELNEKQRKALHSIYRNVKKQETLVEDILDVYKLELGKINLSKKEVSISDLFINVINDLKPLIEEKNITIVTEINTKSESKIYCDEKRIEQVLSNLIKNSIDFVPKNEGKITLRVDDENQNNNLNQVSDGFVSYFIFSVHDNGVGISEDKINNLFNKFYQMDSSATRKHAGTGLGLVICKGIVEAHGGKIWIDRYPNTGTIVKFTLQKFNYAAINIDQEKN